jgi:transposase-like protein
VEFWASVLADVANRGVKDVLIVCCYAALVVMPMMLRWPARTAVEELALSA